MAAGHWQRPTSIPRPLRNALIFTSILLIILGLHRSTDTFSGAQEYAWNRWQGGSTYWDNRGYQIATYTSSSSTTKWGSEEGKQFWAEYFEALSNGKPTIDAIRFRNDYKPGWFQPLYKLTDALTERKQELNMTDHEIDTMISIHKKSADTFKDIAKRLPYNPGTRGVVYSASMLMMPFLLVSLRMLRKTGTTLPVEIWIWDQLSIQMDPWGHRLCKEVIAPLGATCRFVTEYLPDSPSWPYDQPTEKYQNKFDAILFSSFEQIVVLDSDNIAISPLDEVFTTEPFTKYGLVLWPDFWRNTASPYYYQIADLEEESVLTRASTESGQMFIDKGTHGAALLLARYYVLFPNHWLRLLSQDKSDEGDKETFQRAARALDLPFYQIAEPPDRVGHRCPGDQRIAASGQHHPLDDYYLHSLGIRRENNDDILQDGLTPRTMFIHCNWPKLDAAVILAWGKVKQNNIQHCKDGSTHRMWGPRDLTVLKYGWDIEKAVWDQMRWVACETEHIQAQWFDPRWANGTVNNITDPIENICARFVDTYDEHMGTDGLRYDDKLAPAANDDNGDFGLQARKIGWGSTSWRWSRRKGLARA